MKRKALETRFIADSMLGKLAKWLRLAGVDVEYDKNIADYALIKRAFSDSRKTHASAITVVSGQ